MTVLKASLRVGPVSHTAALFAVKRWHYLGSVPAGQRSLHGVWEDGKYVGVVIFSSGANQGMGLPQGLREPHRACELTRVALGSHATPVSRILRIAIKQMAEFSPGIKIIVSYAAAEQGHYGGIYQAGGWVYVGEVKSSALVLHGKTVHPRTINEVYGKRSRAAGVTVSDYIKAYVDKDFGVSGKLARYKYVMPLCPEAKEWALSKAMPYPKKAPRAESIVVDALADPGENEGGSIPTSALH